MILLRIWDRQYNRGRPVIRHKSAGLLLSMWAHWRPWVPGGEGQSEEGTRGSQETEVSALLHRQLCLCCYGGGCSSVLSKALWRCLTVAGCKSLIITLSTCRPAETNNGLFPRHRKHHLYLLDSLDFFWTKYSSEIEVELLDLALWLKPLHFNVCDLSPRSEPCSSLKRHASFVFLHGHDGRRLGGALWWGNVAQQAQAEAGFLAHGQNRFTHWKRKGGGRTFFWYANVSLMWDFAALDSGSCGGDWRNGNMRVFKGWLKT